MREYERRLEANSREQARKVASLTKALQTEIEKMHAQAATVAMLARELEQAKQQACKTNQGITRIKADTLELGTDIFDRSWEQAYYEMGKRYEELLEVEERMRYRYQENEMNAISRFHSQLLQGERWGLNMLPRGSPARSSTENYQPNQPNQYGLAMLDHDRRRREAAIMTFWSPSHAPDPVRSEAGSTFWSPSHAPDPVRSEAGSATEEDEEELSDDTSDDNQPMT